jgi:hypothetical protein
MGAEYYYQSDLLNFVQTVPGVLEVLHDRRYLVSPQILLSYQNHKHFTFDKSRNDDNNVIEVSIAEKTK